MKEVYTLEPESVLVEPLYSAVEIAQMELPGLPHSKPGVLARANAEGWRFENRTGVGGTKKMFELPAKYLKLVARGGRKEPAPALVGTVVSGSNKVDLQKLELAITALTNWERKRGVAFDTERRSAVIALLYDYLVLHEDDGLEAMDRVLRAVG